MPYDALGNYIPGDEPDIDQMQYELAKKGHHPRPLDKVTDHFKSIVTQFNPIMMPKVMQDVGTIGLNMGSTIVSPYADILHNIQASGAAGLHRLAGDEKSALEAEARQRQVSPSSLMREPMLPVTREAEQGLGKVFEASKLPPLGPGSGMPGSAPVSPRPMFTPNDLRVLGAEATRVGRQVGEIPTDFANAQSGLQRIDPVTGQPVLGARIQSGVDRLGDIMEQRRMQGLTPIPGLPAALQPETNMYAVRKSGTRATTPVIPETARGYNPPIDPVNDLFREVTGLEPDRAEATPTLLHSLNRRVQIGNLPDERPAVNAFRSFMETKAQEMYPEAATSREALEIFNAMHYDQQSRHAVENKMFNEFLQTPEARQVMPNAVSTEELANRHEAATEGIKNQWGKYLIKNLGTEGNPLVKMAAEKGLTFLPAEDVMRIAADEAYTATQNRGKGGFPIQGTFAEPIKQTKTELEELNTKINEAAKRQNDLFQAAHVANVDPASMPEYLEARKQVETDTKKKNALQKKLDNLTLASAYEAIEDAAVKPTLAEVMLKQMHAAERGFYPGLKEAAARGETGYKTSIGSLEYMGYVKAAENFYNDVLEGKIPADKARTYPVDKYIRENAEARIKVEQAEKAKIEEHKAAVMKSLKESVDALPNSKTFSNVGVVELTKDTPVDIANREVAASTEALDICIGEGGSGKGTKNLFTGKKDPRYTPIVNLLTGEPNPNATRHTSGYVTELQRGEQLPMFRDLETGMPVAALQFHVSSAIGANGQPKFNIGYASGAGNGRIDAKYIDGVRDYLNSRADEINGIGNNLEGNTGIYDTTNKPSLNNAKKQAQVTADQMKTVDWDTMPRFMTAKDIKQAVQSNVPAPVVQQSQAMQESVAQLKATLIDNIEFTIDNALLETGLPDPDRLERRLEVIFNMMQNQHFQTFFDNPVSSMNDALEFLTRQIYDHSSSSSDMSQEVATALSNYANELQTARDDMLSQQQRAVQPAPQANALTPQRILQQLDVAWDTMSQNAEATSNHRDRLNQTLERYFIELRNRHYLRDPVQFEMDPEMHLTGAIDDLAEQVAASTNAGTDFGIELANALDSYRDDLSNLLNRYRNQQLAVQMQPPAPQTPNLPAEVQQNIDNRNRQITSAYQRPLDPDSAFSNTNDALSEFIDLLDGMATNLYGNGLSFAEIAEHLQGRIRSEIMVLSDPNRVANRGLNGAEAEVLRNRLNSAYGNLATVHDQLAAPEQLRELPVDFFEPDNMHGANEPYTMQSAVDMARDVFEQERIDTNNFDIPSIEQSIYALREGLFDDERIRRLPERQRQSFAEDVAFRLQNMLDDFTARNRPPGQELITDPDQAHRAIENSTANIENDYGEDVANRVYDIVQNIAEHIDPASQLTAFVTNIRRRSQDAGLRQEVREGLDHVADELMSVGREAPQVDNVFGIRGRALPTPVPAQPATAPYRPIPAIIHAMSDQALTADMSEYDRTRVQTMFEALTDAHAPGELENIVSLARSYAMGFWENFSDVQREWLARNIEEYLGDNPPPNTPPPEGHKGGGRIRKYQDGGTVRMEKGGRPPPSGREMYMPKELTTLEKASRFVDDNVTPFVNRGVDAMFPMREMVRIALLSKTQAPLQKLRQQDPHAFDYAMDQASNGNMYPLPKQDEMIPVGKASGGQVSMKTFAEGGTVHKNPSVDQMKYELMKRS
jgi:hypothetical protein